MITKMLVAIALAVLIAGTSFAQQDFLSGQTPPGVDWRQIQSDRFTIIFPEEITNDAQRLANTLEHTYGPVSKTLRGPQKPLEVVLTNQTTVSNGFVGLAPRRSLWSTTPDQNVGDLPGDWLQLLALHEMRHVVQTDRMRRGFIRLWWALSGETGESLVGGLLEPKWSSEGDAVGIETALSESGRGRMPQFDLGIRAPLLAGRRYSYPKAYHLSYRDWYPDHYTLGYFMTTYVKRRYGPEMWDKVMGSFANRAFHPFAFNSALKKHTGASTSQTYERTMDELTELWQAQQKDLHTTPLRVLAGQSQSGVWTNYKYPHYLADGSVLASKSGLADPATLIRLYPDGREERVRFYSPLGGIRAAGGKIAWNRFIPDVRWGRRDYSDVVVLDIASGRMHQLTHKAKLFAPAPSPDGTRLAAIEFGPDRRCNLVLLETASGAEQARFPAPDGVYWRTPAWSEDGCHIAVVRQDARGNALERIDAVDGEGQIVLPHTHDEIGWPIFWGSYLLFDSPYSGIDNIHAVHLSSGAHYQVTSRPLAATHVSVDGDSLLFEEYTLDGYRIAVMPLDPATWTPIEQVVDRRVRYYEPLIDQEQGGSVLADIPQQVYPVHRYRPMGHLLKIHSWDPDLLGSHPTYSLNLKSSDLLNLSEMSSGIEYNSNEKTFGVSGDFSLAAWYPIFSLGGRWGNRTVTYQIKDKDNTDESKEEIIDKWAEKSLRAGVEVPLNLSRGPWQSSVHLSTNAEWTEITHKNDPNQPDSIGVFEVKQDGQFAPLTYQLAFDRSRSKAERDLAPVWGQHLQLTYRHTPFAGDYHGTLLSGQLSLFFPGLIAHHSLKLEGVYEWQPPAAEDTIPYSFESEQPFVRGYDYRFHHHFYRGSANYALPLFYPDWSLGALVHLKRVKCNFFYDHGFGKDNSLGTTYQTAGAELTANLHLFSLFIPWDMGVRYSYRFDEGDSRFEFMFNLLAP
jgi:hypothetical protein